MLTVEDLDLNVPKDTIRYEALCPTCNEVCVWEVSQMYVGEPDSEYWWAETAKQLRLKIDINCECENE